MMSHFVRARGLVIVLGLIQLVPSSAAAELPTGYLVWSKGVADDPTTRRCYRMTLPEKSEVKALTSGEDVSCVISPDGKWVAYSKAKAAGGSDYHAFNLWKVYIVSIHGAEQGREEIELDADGYWPSWGGPDLLYYNKPDGSHTTIIRVTLTESGRVRERETFFSSKEHFSAIREINEAVVAPDGSWFAARTRGVDSVTGVGSYTVDPPEFSVLARAGKIGCMPHMAPSGKWAAIAGADKGIRWGDAPGTPNRQQDQLLLPAIDSGFKAYHPSIATDERWVLASHGEDWDHNASTYDVYIYELDPEAHTTGEAQLLVQGGFNGWPHVWVGEPSEPPPPLPIIESFRPDRYTILSGDSVMLVWQTQQAHSAELDGQPVFTNGFKDYQPTANKAFELVVSNAWTDEPAQQTVQITVNETAQPVEIESFAVEPPSVDAGQTARVSWSVRNATTLTLAGEPVAPVGSLEISPGASLELELEALGHQGPVRESATLEVREIEPEGLPLLEDSGGFTCSLGTAPGPAAGLQVLALLLVMALALLSVRRTLRSRAHSRGRRGFRAQPR